MQSKKRVVVTQYRTLLNLVTKENLQNIFKRREYPKLYTLAVKELCPVDVQQNPQFKNQRSALGIQALVKASFRADAQLVLPGEVDEALNRGLNAIRSINRLSEPARLKGLRRTNTKASVRYSIGQVVRHKCEDSDYRVVVVSWKRTYRKLDKKVLPPKNPKQPFYWVLPDDSDCLDKFGETLPIQHVAEDQLVSDVQGKDREISHADIDRYFEGFCSQKSAFIPNGRARSRFSDEKNFSSSYSAVLFGISGNSSLLKSSKKDS